MTVLGDEDLRTRIGRGELVLGGSVDHVGSCAYEFRPGKIVRCGAQDEANEVLDWVNEATAPRTRLIAPGEMVWIRTREEVHMPADVCAFWWQTNRLSRQGLMLINMSMVEPGYRGFLACLFVNFGRTPVTLDAETSVAKLVFVELSSRTQPYDGIKPTDYDSFVTSAARLAPSKFLDIASLLAVETQAAKRELDEYTTRQQESIREDTQATVRQSLWPLVIAGFVIFVAVTFLPWLQSWVRPDINDAIDQKIDETLSERLVLFGDSPEPELERRLQELEDKVGKGETTTTSGS